jgi:hypothetical protein
MHIVYVGCLHFFLLKHNSRPNLTTPPIQASLTEGWHIQAHWLYNCFHPKYPQVLGGYLIFLMTSSSSFWKKLKNQSTFGCFLKVFRIKEPSFLISQKSSKHEMVSMM